jgi:hypothetical protein
MTTSTKAEVPATGRRFNSYGAHAKHRPQWRVASMTNINYTYASIAERDAAIERIRQHQAHRGHYFSYLYTYKDDVDPWSSYWYCQLDGDDVGDMFFDSFGSVVKGDALGVLSYKAHRDAEIRAEEEEEMASA